MATAAQLALADAALACLRRRPEFERAIDAYAESGMDDTIRHELGEAISARLAAMLNEEFKREET